MMARHLCVILTICLMAACTPQADRVYLPAEQAEQICTERAKRYSLQPRLIPDENGTIQVGLQSETPDDFMIRDFYKRCYRSNTGVWPETVPKIPSYS